MLLLKNMKIRNYLFLGFDLLLSITVIIMVYSGFQILHVDSQYSHVMKFSKERLETLNELAVGLMDAQRTINLAAMYIHDIDDLLVGIERQSEGIRNIRANMDSLITRYRANVTADSWLDITQKAELLSLFSEYEDSIILFDDYIERLLVASRRFDEHEVIHLANQSVITIERASSTHAHLQNEAWEHVRTVREALTIQSRSTLDILMVLALAGLLFRLLLHM